VIGGAGVWAMVAATLLWGATFVVVRDSLEAVGPAALVAARFGAATLLWGVVLGLRAAAGRNPSRDAARAAALAGLLGGPFATAGYLFQAVGLEETTAGNSAFLTSTGTLFAAPLAWLVLRQRPTGLLGAGLLLALAGSALLGIRGPLRMGAGESWTLLGALAYAMQIVVVGRWARQADPTLLVAIQAGVTAVLLSPWMADFPRPIAALPGARVLGLAYLVVAGSVLAPLLQVLAQRVLPAGRIGLLFALEPVFALAFALSWGQERFEPRQWLGAGLILAGVVIVEIRATRQRESSSRPATARAAGAP
jgi:drug/metabolite transporter (DMT)-like permease